MSTKTNQPSGITSFLWWSVGADPSILKQLPSEGKKFTSIASAIFLISIFAVLSGGYIFSAVFNSKIIGISFGIMWGVFVFILERLTLYTGTTNTPLVTKLRQVFPSLIINTLLAIIIVTPINLKIFEQEINSSYAKISEAQTSEQLNKLKIREAEIADQIKALSAEIDSAKKRANDLLDAYTLELKSSKSEISGLGPRALQLQQLYSMAKTNLDHVERQNTSLINEYKQFEFETIKEIQSRGAPTQKTFLGRFQTYSDLRRNNSTIALISFLTTLLILVISLFPFIIQLTSGKNAYGDYIQLKEEILFEEYDIIANNKEHLAGKVEELKERFTIDTKDLESLVKNIDTTSTKKKDENSFTSYLQEMLSRYNDEIINNERKSKSLFWYGIVFSVFGIMTAFGFLVFWLNYFSFNKFETYHVYTLISGTVIIVLIEFLGAWFLKQHRIVSSKSLQILSHKAVIDRYALMYKAVTDLAGPENRLTYLSHLLSLIEKDLKFPKTAFDSTSDFANDATSSLLKVGKFS